MKHGYASYMRHFNIFTMSFADVRDLNYLTSYILHLTSFPRGRDDETRR